MHQIDVSSAAATPPASTGPGTPGFFTDGNPTTGTPATIVPAEFLNAVMLEILNVLVAAGIAPVKSNNAQLLSAINQLITNRIPDAPDYATTDQSGVVELATSTETIIGTDPYRAVTPEGLAALINYLNFGTAAFKNIGASGDAVPLLNGSNTWENDQVLDNGGADSPAYCWKVTGLKLNADLIISSGKTIFRIWWNAGSAGEILAEYNITDVTSKIFGQDVYTKGNVSSFAQSILDDGDGSAVRTTIGAVSSADVPGIIAGMSVGAVGSYILARANTGTSTGSAPQQAGTTYSGSSLTPSNAGASDASNTTTMTGTWRLMCFLYNADVNGEPDSVGLFLRIA